MSTVQADAPVKDIVSWVTEAQVNSGYLTFCQNSEDSAIKTSRTYGARFVAFTLEKVNNEEEGDSFAHQENFYPILYKMLNRKEDWGTEFFLRGRASFELGVMEWTESILDRFKGKLDQAGIYGAVGVSRFPYHFCSNTWKAFCELWSPLTNTLHHGAGEMSMSLYDLMLIGGLPLLGVPYEEFIPVNKELQPTDSNTLADLLRIHSELCVSHSRNHILWDQWLAYFYRGRILYAAFGESKYRRDRVQPEKFMYRKVASDITKEVELAAFLAFWLSRFVLPSPSSRIRPETFYMACLMARGNRVSLAPTVLGCIYHGLGELVTGPRAPSVSQGCLPVHYVIGWLGEHFTCFYRRRVASDFPANYPYLARYAGVDGEYLDITSARVAFRTAESIDYRPAPFIEEKGSFFLDDQSLSEKRFEFLASIRSSLLPVRMGSELWLEPYYPNRFARQFGFDQGTPSNKLLFAVEKRKQCCIEDLARAQRALLMAETGSRFYIPRSTYNGACTWRYCRWWMRACAPYLGRSVTSVYLALKKRPLEKKNHVFVIRSLREVSQTLRKEILLADIEREKPNSRFGTSSAVRDVKRKRGGDSREKPDSPRDKGLKQTHNEDHADFGDVTADNIGFLYEDHIPYTNGDDDQVAGAGLGATSQTKHSTFKEAELAEPNPNIEKRTKVPDTPDQQLMRTEQDSGENSNTHNMRTDLVVLDTGASHNSCEEVASMSLHQIFGPEVKENHRRFILDEMHDILKKLTSTRSPQELLACQDDVKSTVALLTPMIVALGTGKAEFNWFSKTTNQIFSLATQLKQGMGIEKSVDIALLRDLSRRQDMCQALKKNLVMQLLDSRKQLEELKSREHNIIEAERQASEAAGRAKLLRDTFEAARRNLEEKINGLEQSSEEQDKLDGELRQKRIEAREDKLPEFENIKASNESGQMQLAKLVDSLKIFAAQTE